MRADIYWFYKKTFFDVNKHQRKLKVAIKNRQTRNTNNNKQKLE
jgi:hypothetical protein